MKRLAFKHPQKICQMIAEYLELSQSIVGQHDKDCIVMRYLAIILLIG
jgi:hypothetical protein